MMFGSGEWPVISGQILTYGLWTKSGLSSPLTLDP
jgi:hypothetical protein